MQKDKKPAGDRIPLEDAARIIFEAMEEAGVDDKAATLGSSSSAILEHYKWLILSTAKKGAVKLHGTRLPSRKSLPIRQGELDGLTPIKDTNNLRPRGGAMRITEFAVVCISKDDLDRIIRNYIKRLKKSKSAPPLQRAVANSASAVPRHEATEKDEANFRAFAKNHFETRGFGPDYQEAEKWAADARIEKARYWSRKVIKNLDPAHRRERGRRAR